MAGGTIYHFRYKIKDELKKITNIFQPGSENLLTNDGLHVRQLKQLKIRITEEEKFHVFLCRALNTIIENFHFSPNQHNGIND